jgi:glycosyltransferase involved in cell wall biosynthesis
MITYNDEECVRDTMENVMPYVTEDFVVVDGGSTDGTLEILKKQKGIHLLEKKWEDNFELQKNFALDATTQEWRILIDADEQYEHLFWNQLPWYIAKAEVDGVDCISVPRINIVDGLTQDMVEKNGWQLSHFNWVNYPDYQQRLYKRNCKYSGRTHERIVGLKKSDAIVGQHIVHRKSSERQERGLKRERDQYKISAVNIKKRLGVEYGKKLIIHCVESLGDNFILKYKIREHIKFLINNEADFHYSIAFPAHTDLSKGEEFIKLMGENNMIKFGSLPELFYILEETKPYIVHMLTEFAIEKNLAVAIRNRTKHFIEKNIDGTPEDSLNFYRRIGAQNG